MPGYGKTKEEATAKLRENYERITTKWRFLRKNANLLALTRNGANDVFRRITSSMMLDQEAQSNVMWHADTIDQKGIAGKIGRETFQAEMYRAICVAFLRIQRNYKVEFVSKLTPEASAELEAIEVTAGERAPAPPQKSAQELLVEQVKED